MDRTYLFYDIETTGLNKSFDQIVQFAGIRTDLELNEIERYEFFVRLNRDVIPSPKAFITHRILPSALASGLTELEAICKIHALLNTPGTISIGYNSLAFDDEFLRFSFYRNLLPPYTHQYANDCSRMDLYPMTVMYFLYQNAIINWPEDNLKLENLIKVNQLESGQAHNAMVDAAATLKLAQRFRQDLKTWHYLIGYFDKQTDLLRCEQAIKYNAQPIAILVDGKLSAKQHYQTAALPLGMHEHYKNQYLWLRLDRDSLMETTPDNFTEQTFVIKKKLGEPAWILPIKERFLHPYLKEKKGVIQQTADWIARQPALFKLIRDYYLNFQYPIVPQIDVDAALYQTHFISWQDQAICRKIHQAPPDKKLNYYSALSESHLQQLLIRIMGRHYPELLSGMAKESFEQYVDYLQSNCRGEIYLDYKGSKRLTPEQAYQEIQALNQQPLDDQQKQILSELEAHLINHFKLASKDEKRMANDLGVVV